MYTKNLYYDIQDIFMKGYTEGTVAYNEASIDVKKFGGKILGFMKKIIRKIVSKFTTKKLTKVDSDIRGSKGNVDKFSHIAPLETSIRVLKELKNATANKVGNDIESIVASLRSYKQYYENAYSKQADLIIIEYECTLYLCYTSAQYALACYYNLDGNAAKQTNKETYVEHGGLIFDTLHRMAEKIKDKSHVDYMKEIVKISENMVLPVHEAGGAGIEITIDGISNIVDNINAIARSGMNIFGIVKRSLFGIIPLIQCAVSIWYRRKVNTIMELDEQIRLIERNMEQLKNRKNIDDDKKEEILKKQQASVDELRKKSEKLRAQLIDTEKEAAEDVEKDTKDSKEDTKNDKTSDDDIVLG